MKWIPFVFVAALASKCFAADTSAYDFEALTVTNGAAVGLTSSKLSPSNGPLPVDVFITVEDTDVRFRLDGTSPTTTEGHKLTTTPSGMTVTGYDNLKRLKFIGISGTADVKVTYER